jgi:muconolactone delta-isomerase
MEYFMVDVDLPLVLSEEFVSLIPKQRARVNELMDKGLVLGYSLSHDRSKLWITFKAKGISQVRKALNSFPLYKFFQVQIYPLMFHNHVIYAMPEPLPN